MGFWKLCFDKRENVILCNKEGKDRRNKLLNAPSSKSWRLSNKNTEKSIIENLRRLSRRNKRGHGINEETALLSPWQWRFGVDRMQSRFASNVDMRTCQPARFWRKIALFVTWRLSHWLVCVVAGDEENVEEEGDLSLRRRCPRLVRGWPCSYGRLA